VKLDEIQFFPTQDIPAEERMFRTGQLDITAMLPSSKIDVYRKERPLDLHIDRYAGISYYRFNVKEAPFNDRRVRKALSLAINREALTRDVMRGGESPMYAVSYPNDSGYTPEARLSGGVTEARSLLAEAAYPGGQGLPKIKLLYNTSETNRSLAEAIQAMWRTNLGFEAELENQEWKVYLDSLRSHHFQLIRSGWIADYEDPNVFLEIFTTGNGNNEGEWSNAEYDRLAAAALAAHSEAERYANYQKMDAILVEECPILPIYYYTHPYAMSPRVKGYWDTLLDNHPWKSVWLDSH